MQPYQNVPPNGSEIFDLPDSDGVNSSEKKLVAFCKKSFLRLWTLPNLMKKQNPAKELTDVLIVFGDDVIIFSDKSISINPSTPVDTAWARCYRKTIESSANQLYGAAAWIKEHPQKIFLDAKSTRPLPIDLPDASKIRFHLIASVNGVSSSASLYHRKPRGSFEIDSSIVGNDHLSHPFSIGNLDARREFVHVFDENSLELIMSELDTAKDFLDYLIDRKKLMTSGKRVLARGEEDLFAAYLINGDDQSRSFTGKGVGVSISEKEISFENDLFSNFSENPFYRQKKKRDETGYLWDQLIDDLITTGTSDLAPTQTHGEIAAALQTMAQENRFWRRTLCEALNTARAEIQADGLSPDGLARTIAIQERPDIAYQFIFMPYIPGENETEYRRKRSCCAIKQCAITRQREPSVRWIISLCFCSTPEINNSIDLIVEQVEAPLFPNYAPVGNSYTNQEVSEYGDISASSWPANHALADKIKKKRKP